MVASKCGTCKEAGIIRRACFGPVGGVPLHCEVHRTDEEVDVVHAMCPICEAEGIRRRVTFSPLDGDPAFCSECAKSLEEYEEDEERALECRLQYPNVNFRDRSEYFV